MEEFALNELKSWREKLGLSQQRFATIANVSLLTVRQLEIGQHSPRKATLAKILEGVKAVEINPELAAPKRRGRRKATETAETMEGAPQVEGAPAAEGAPAEGAEAPTAEVTLPRRRGRPRKTEVAGAEAASMHLGRPLRAAEATLMTPKPAPSPYIFSADEAHPIKLSNLDLELINRILNMTGREKMDLLMKLS
jgi:transcriptional regulator with XRE-family HTH domain